MPDAEREGGEDDMRSEGTATIVPDGGGSDANGENDENGSERENGGGKRGQDRSEDGRDDEESDANGNENRDEAGSEDRTDGGDEDRSEDGGGSDDEGSEDGDENVENGEEDEGDEETYEVTVTVQNGDGESVPAASLTLEESGLGLIEGFRSNPTRGETDADGQVSFEVGEGEYEIEATSDGAQAERTLTVDGDEELTLTVDIGERAGDEEGNGDKDEAVEEDERSGPKEAEGRIAEEETPKHGTPRGTTVLYLDLEGLVLDLLGLEVDLHEVTLDVRATTGEGRLLGNLLAGVANLLSPLSALLNRLLNTVLNLLSYLTSPIGTLRGAASRVWSVVTSPIGALSSAGSRIWNTLTAPVGWVRKRFGSDEGDEDNGEGDDALPESTSNRLQLVRERLPSLPSPSVPSLPSPSVPSLPSLSSVFFSAVNRVLDGLIALLDENGDGDDEEASEGETGETGENGEGGNE